MSAYNVVAYLPPSLGHEDMASMIGRYAGLPAADPRGFGIVVPGVTVRATTRPAVSDLVLHGEMVHGFSTERATLYFENQALPSHRKVVAVSTPFWVAAFVRLTSEFGGMVDFDESEKGEGERPYDIAFPEPPRALAGEWPLDAEIDAEYNAMQRRIAEAVPLSSEELAKAEDRALEDYGRRDE